MDRKLKITMIAIWSFIAIMLTILLVYNITIGRSKWHMFGFNIMGESLAKVQKEQTLGLDNCSKIVLDFSSADINVKKSDDSQLKIVQKASKSLDEGEKFIASQDGNTITVRKGSSQVFSIFNMSNFQQIIDVYIPEGYNKDLDLRLSSGDINIEPNMNLNDLLSKQSSGSFNGNGNIKVNTAKISSTSGDIDIRELISNTYDVSAVSGEVSINALAGSGSIDTKSGDIKVNFTSIGDNTKINAVSGEISISIPKEASIDFDGRCVSGDINTNLDLNYKSKRGNEAVAKVGQEPYKKLIVRTTSGDININR